MNEEPLFLASDVGALTGMVTLPDSPPVAAAVIVQGRGSTRSGVNQTFTRLGRALAEQGIACLRADYAGLAESWDADSTRHLAGVRALVDAYREITSAPLLMVGSCYGLGATWAICQELPVHAAAIIAPPLARPEDIERATARGRYQRRRSLRQVAVHFRDGAPRRARLEQVEHVPYATVVSDIVARTPVLVMVGTKDRSATTLQEVVAELPPTAQVELRVFEGQMLHGAPTIESQSAIHDGILSWATRSIGVETRT